MFLIQASVFICVSWDFQLFHQHICVYLNLRIFTLSINPSHLFTLWYHTHATTRSLFIFYLYIFFFRSSSSKCSNSVLWCVQFVIRIDCVTFGWKYEIRIDKREPSIDLFSSVWLTEYLVRLAGTSYGGWMNLSGRFAIEIGMGER